LKLLGAFGDLLVDEHHIVVDERLLVVRDRLLVKLREHALFLGVEVRVALKMLWNIHFLI